MGRTFAEDGAGPGRIRVSLAVGIIADELSLSGKY